MRYHAGMKKRTLTITMQDIEIRALGEQLFEISKKPGWFAGMKDINSTFFNTIDRLAKVRGVEIEDIIKALGYEIDDFAMTVQGKAAPIAEEKASGDAVEEREQRLREDLQAYIAEHGSLDRISILDDNLYQRTLSLARAYGVSVRELVDYFGFKFNRGVGFSKGENAAAIAKLQAEVAAFMGDNGGTLKNLSQKDNALYVRIKYYSKLMDLTVGDFICDVLEIEYAGYGKSKGATIEKEQALKKELQAYVEKHGSLYKLSVKNPSLYVRAQRLADESGEELSQFIKRLGFEYAGRKKAEVTVVKNLGIKAPVAAEQAKLEERTPAAEQQVAEVSVASEGFEDITPDKYADLEIPVCDLKIYREHLPEGGAYTAPYLGYNFYLGFVSKNGIHFGVAKNGNLIPLLPPCAIRSEIYVEDRAKLRSFYEKLGFNLDRSFATYRAARQYDSSEAVAVMVEYDDGGAWNKQGKDVITGKELLIIAEVINKQSEEIERKFWDELDKSEKSANGIYSDIQSEANKCGKAYEAEKKTKLSEEILERRREQLAKDLRDLLSPIK